ncbi:tripartite motif-containing protein 16-like isoform X1 [Scophthalmus maximus]|uniref:tripartite motif-containing protein 16-like isoform X1 n=1 Tax=Scophthalmus maximus TaxID=52904 RepID=UPI001FA843C4|nr:tripartite motif-containing protein 16-like isoform X1 [Scophthalmus maximus]
MATLSSNDEENLKEVEHHSHAKEEPEEPTTRTSGTPVPQDVLCDSCLDSPSRAIKSCLTCLVSYCEAHLRPHREKTKFQNHRLVDPLHDIDCGTCAVHQLLLERFCLTDGCCVCVDCESQEHKGHATAPVGEARAQIETEMQKEQEEISQSTSAAEKTIEKLHSNNDSIKSSVQELCVSVEQQFARVQSAVMEARKGVMEVLEGEQRRALRQAEGIQAHLEQRGTELMKMLARMNKMSRIKSDVDFLKEYSEWKKGAADVRLPSVHINRLDHLTSYVQVLTDATQKLCDVILSSYRDKLGTFCKGSKSLIPEPTCLADPETREDFLKYTTSLTFDPDTTHHFLRVTEDSRKVTNTSPWQHSYPDHPDRFEYWRQAMTSQSVYLGRRYVEAELSGEGAHVGVTYKSIDRKGEQSSCCITGNDFSWCMGRNSRGFFAWHAGLETALEGTEIKRIGLYVDFHPGSVSFYDTTGPMRLLHRYQVDFIEPLYVTVWLSKKDNVVSLVDAE